MPPIFLVLSEDGSHDAVPSLVALTKRMCQLVVPAVGTHRLRFEPPEPRLRRSLTANKWRSRSAEDQFLRTELVRTIATHLLRPEGFVIFHFDGDTCYRERAASPNPEQFGRQIVSPVSQLLRQRRTDDEAARIAQKLITYVPHYCVEAWTYYNLPVLVEICRAQTSARDEQTLATWQAAPAEIEEVEKPWSFVSAGKAHNRILTERGYPTQVAFDAGKSFTDTVVALLNNPQLVAALEDAA